MKTGLHVKAHGVLPEQQVIEVSWKGTLIGTIYGSDGPGIRFITKYNAQAVRVDTGGLTVVELRIDPNDVGSKCSGPG